MWTRTVRAARADQDGSLLLTVAMLTSRADVCEALMSAPLDAAHASHDMLWLAAAKGMAGMCKVLADVARYVDRAARADAYDSTALRLAAFNGHADVCEVLTSSKYASKFAACADDCDSMALRRAVEAGHAAMCRVLMSAPEHAVHGCADAGHLLSRTAMSGLVDVCKVLVSAEYAHPAHADMHDSCALALAAKNGHAEVCAVLMGASCNPAHADARYSVALALAACYGHAKVFDVLLNVPHHAAHVNDQMPSSPSALMEAARYDRAEACEVLLAHGADVGNLDGMTLSDDILQLIRPWPLRRQWWAKLFPSVLV